MSCTKATLGALVLVASLALVACAGESTAPQRTSVDSGGSLGFPDGQSRLGDSQGTTSDTATQPCTAGQCDDNNACTDDTCTATGCVHTPSKGAQFDWYFIKDPTNIHVYLLDTPRPSCYPNDCELKDNAFRVIEPFAQNKIQPDATLYQVCRNDSGCLDTGRKDCDCMLSTSKTEGSGAGYTYNGTLGNVYSSAHPGAIPLYRISCGDGLKHYSTAKEEQKTAALSVTGCVLEPASTVYVCPYAY